MFATMTYVDRQQIEAPFQCGTGQQTLSSLFAATAASPRTVLRVAIT